MSGRAAAACTLSASVLLGTQGTVSALLVPGAPPAVLGTLRIQVTAAVLIVLMPLLGGSRRRLLTVCRRPAILIAAICVGGFQPLFFAGTSMAGMALGSLIAIGTTPVFAGLLGWLFLGHRLSRAWCVATAIAVSGLALRTWGHLEGAVLAGILVALLAGLLSGGYTVAAKRELEHGVTPAELPAAAFSLGGPILAPFLVIQPIDWMGHSAGASLVL